MRETANRCFFRARTAKNGAPAAASLVGTWSANEAEGAAYVFNDDGTGKWDMGDGLEMNFTYTDDGKTVGITYEGSSSTDTYEYTIEGDLLTMTDPAMQTTLTYTKK